MAVEIKVPTAGESITEVQIGAWMKNEGDFVDEGEVVCEIETDKASMELPAPSAGVLAKIARQAGETVKVGEVIGSIDESKAAEAKSKKSSGREAKAAGATDSGRSATAVAEAPSRGRTQQEGDPRVMPSAARVLAENKLTVEDVTPTGPGGRVLKEDAERAVEARRKSGSSERVGRNTAGGGSDNGHTGGSREEQVVPMTMLRRRIAERLVEAQQTAAILTTFNEIDMSAVIDLRKERQDEFTKKYGVKLGFMSFFVKAAIDALKQFPAVNAEIRGHDIVYKNYYDVGVAVSTDRGLVVPVVRNAELLSFAEIELKIAELAQRARDKQLAVEELQGGTFTISNGGVFGSLMSTPILNPPQSGILGLHATQDRPVARDGQVQIRPMMYVAMSYDHRIIDGRESVSFLKRIKDCIESPVRMLIEA